MLVASAASRIGGHGGVEEEDWWWYRRKVPIVSWWAALWVRPRKLREEFIARLFQIQVPTEATSCALHDFSMQIHHDKKNDSKLIKEPSFPVSSKLLLASN